jgi:hypothetical protein
MNPLDSLTGGKAVLRYEDADFTILESGSFVLCAVTGARIPLESLRYWSVDRQEAYVDAAASLMAHQQNLKEDGA